MIAYIINHQPQPIKVPTPPLHAANASRIHGLLTCVNGFITGLVISAGYPLSQQSGWFWVLRLSLILVSLLSSLVCLTCLLAWLGVLFISCCWLVLSRRIICLLSGLSLDLFGLSLSLSFRFSSRAISLDELKGLQWILSLGEGAKLLLFSLEVTLFWVWWLQFHYKFWGQHFSQQIQN